MTLLVTFIDINDETGESIGTSWTIESPQVEWALRHMAEEHFGEPMLQTSDEEAFAEVKEIVERGETLGEARTRICEDDK